MRGEETQIVNAAVPAGAANSSEIDLMELFYALLRSWKLILLCVVLGTALSAVYTTQLVTPMYKATSKLYVLSSKDSAINLSDLQIGAALTSDYKEVFNTWEVHEQVNQNLGLSYTYTELEKMLTITNPPNTRILQITVQSPSADEATFIANEYALVAQKYISDTMRTDEPSMMSVALKSLRPSSPSLTTNLILGFLLGAMLSFGIVFLRFMFDDKIKSPDDILKYAGLPTLAIVPRSSEFDVSDIGGDKSPPSSKKGGRRKTAGGGARRDVAIISHTPASDARV